MIRNLIAKLTRKRQPALATVAQILAPYGVSSAADHGFLCKVGKAATAIHVAQYGVKPAKVTIATISGHAITVAGYPAADHWMVTEAYITVGVAEFYSLAA